MAEKIPLRLVAVCTASLVLGLFLFLLLYPRYDDLSALAYSFDQNNAIKKSESLAEELGADISNLQPSVKLGRNSDLIRDHQMRNGLATTAKRINEDVPGFYWIVEYSRPRTGSDSTGNNAKEELLFHISTRGELLSIGNEFSEVSLRNPSLEDKEMLRAMAFRYLNQFTSYDSTDWVFGKEDFSISREDSIYRFEWENYDAVWTDSLVAKIELQGSRFAGLSLELKSAGRGQFDQDDVMSIISLVFTLIISLIILVQIVKRLRQDKIDLRMGWTIGGITAVLWAAMMLSTMLQERWWEILLAVPLGGLFLGLGILAVVPVAESMARDVWNEKLYTLDSLIRGRFKTLKVGQSILSGLGLTGILLAMSIACYAVADAAGGVYVNRDPDYMNQFFTRISAAYFLGKTWTGQMYGMFAFVVFGFTLLRRWIVKSGLFIVACAALVALLPVSWLELSPAPSSNLAHFAIGVVLAWGVLRFDFLSLFVSVLSLLSILNASPLLLQGSPLLLLNGLLICIPPIGFLGLAVLSTISPQSEENVKEYTPPYLLRISERERFQKELEIARTVQLKFLPNRKPESRWLDVASVCVPAYEVGGDYYDYFQLDQNRLGVVVGDVSGKGVSAAFFMTLLKGILVSQTRHTQSPREILIQMNDLFYENAQRGVFISIVFGVFDQATQSFTYARAGHNPVIVLGRENKNSEELCPQGIALGLDKGKVFAETLEEVEIALSPGDVFVFYTDGFSEAMNAAHQEFGEERLGEAIISAKSRAASDVLNNVQEAVREFTGNTQQHDDMTMVVVRIGKLEPVSSIGG